MRTICLAILFSVSVPGATWVMQQNKGAGTTAASTTAWLPIGTGQTNAVGVTTSDACVFQTAVAGTFSHLSINVSANATSGAGTLTFQKGTGAYPPTMSGLNETITITAGTSQLFEDTTHSDHVNVGDWVAIKLVSGSGGTTTFREISIWFTPDAPNQTVTWFGTAGTNAISGAATYFQTFISLQATSSGTRPEESEQLKFRTAGTLQNYCFNLSVNSVTSGTTVRTRINGANGGLSASVANGTTGNICLTGTPDTIVDGDLVTISVVTASAGSFTMTSGSAQFITTNNTALAVIEQVSGNSVVNETNYSPLNGTLFTGGTTPGLYYTKFMQTSIVDRLSIHVVAKTMTGSSTFGFFKNGTADSSLQVSVASGASVPAWFVDDVNNDTYSAGDTLEAKAVMGTGTSMQFQAQTARVTLAPTPTPKHRVVSQ